MPHILNLTGGLSAPRGRVFDLGTGTPFVPVPGIFYTAQPAAITEGGANQTLSFRLATEPTSGVVVAVASGDTSALATTGGSFVSFTTSNWDTAQSITLTAPADSDIVDETVTVTLTGTSTDSDYSGELSTFTVTVTDAGAPVATQQMWFWDNNGDINDGNGHQVAPADGAGRLTELEMTAGTTVPVWITLSENPGATVTVALAENETLLGINKSGLGTYRVSDNWNARGGGHGFNVILGPAAASGSTFSVTATASSSDDDWDDVVTTLTVIAA